MQITTVESSKLLLTQMAFLYGVPVFRARLGQDKDIAGLVLAVFRFRLCFVTEIPESPQYFAPPCEPDLRLKRLV